MAGTEESQLMGSDRKALVRQGRRKDLFRTIHEDVKYAATFFADKMLMTLDEGVKMLRSPDGQDLQLFFSNELLQIPIDGSQTDVGHFFSDLLVDLVCRRMRSLVFDGLPNNFKLLCLSARLFHFWVPYA